MNNKLLTACVFATLASVSTLADAAVVSGYGVQASALTWGDCPSFCRGGTTSGETNGTEFSTGASAEDNVYAIASSTSGFLASASFLPILHASASSSVGKGADGDAFAVQGYSYSGADRSVTLNYNLHGLVGDNPDGYVFNQLEASIAVITGSEMEWFPDFGTLVFEIAKFTPGLDVLDTGSASISDALSQNEGGSITFDLTDGMDFYVVASLSATSRNGFADASNTLSLQFNDDSGLQASTVPVPAAIWLFGSGILGLIHIGRRKNV